MFLLISKDGEIRLEEPDCFDAFSVRTESDSGLPAAIAALGRDAIAEPPHIWLRVERLQALGAQYGSADWAEGCTSMLAYARKKGFFDPQRNAVRAHIESA